jgi:hypothetical protein
MKRTVLALLVFAFLVAPTMADIITPVGLEVSSTYCSYNKQDLINNSGLSGGLHGTDYRDMWMSGEWDTTPWLVFDLGNLCTITSTDIWQYNADFALNRGVNNFDILGSTDNISFSPITNANLAIGPGVSVPAQNIVFNTVAQYIKFDVLCNHGHTVFTGLSEVKFNGTVVPVPGAGLLGIIGLGLAGAKLGRRRA